MGLTVYPKKYLQLNAVKAKKLNVVVDIDGLGQSLTLLPIYQKLRYGDPRLVYGAPGLLYGGLILAPNVQTLLMKEALTISQKIEPEQGRGSVSTLSLSFLDKNGFMTKLISPGVLLDEPLGNKLVTVYLGYQNSAYPDDYFRVFRGYISKTVAGAGKVTLELSDANIKNRQNVFDGGTNFLAQNTDNAQLQIPVNVLDSFFDPVTAPDGSIDWQLDPSHGTLDLSKTVRAFIQVDSEWMEYPYNGILDAEEVSFSGTTSIGTNTITSCAYGPGGPPSNGQIVVGPGVPTDSIVTNVAGGTVTVSKNSTANGTASFLAVPTVTVFRGGQYSQGTIPAAHTAGTQVVNAVELYGNPLTLALKIMLSGYGGPWITGETCVAIGTTLDPSNPNNAAMLFAVDVVEVYGLTIGDQVILTGGPNAGSYFIDDIQNANAGLDLNRIIVLSSALVLDNPATSTIGFRSKYDTLPLTCGLKNTPRDVDVATFESVRDTFFSTGFTMQLFEPSEQQGKDFIESELFLPLGIYSITRYGRLSVAVTKPPLVDEKLIQVDQTNVLRPGTIVVERALNTRRFYNLIQYNYDIETDGQTYRTQNNFIDTISETKVNLTQTLAINSAGLRTELGGATVAAQRGLFILNRYKKAAYQIPIKVNWETGCLIEVGDMVLLYDPGTLQISNLETGQRGLGKALFEVIGRSLDIVNGVASLTLLSSLGYSFEQRYATISPSSLIVSATPTALLIKDSFGPAYPGNEQKKWLNFLNLPIFVHSPNYTTRAGTAILTGFDPTNPYSMQLQAPGLPFTPQPGDVVEIGDYGSGYPFCYLDPTLTIVTGISQTQFTLSAPDAAQVVVGQPILIRDAGWGVQSAEVVVQSVIGTTVTLVKNLGFVPSAGQKVELVGFIQDKGGAFRLL